MSNRLRSVLLVIALLWQTVGMFSPCTVAQRADQMVHMVVHSQDVDNHHHSDQSLHLEASGGLDSHEHADEGLTPAGLLPGMSLGVLRLSPASPATLTQQEYIPPFLDGLLRPPTTLA